MIVFGCTRLYRAWRTVYVCTRWQRRRLVQNTTCGESGFWSFAFGMITSYEFICSKVLNMASSPTIDEVVRQSEQLCREYIYSRLKRHNLLTPKLEALSTAGFPSNQTSEVSQEVQMLGGELEKMYPDLYESISRQLHVTMSSESLIRKTFSAIAEQLFRGTVTWGKVVALFAIGSSLACDCTSQGHPEYVKAVIETFARLSRKYLAEWIITQGGWTDVIRAFRTTPEAPFIWSFSVLGVLIGCFCILMATVNL